MFDIDTQLKTKKLGIYSKGYIDKNDNSLEQLLYADSDFEEEVDLKWNEIGQKLAPILKSLLKIAVAMIAISGFCYLFGNNWLKSFSIPLFSGVGYIGAPAIFIYLFKEQFKNLTKTIFCSKKIKTYTYKPTFSPEQFESIFSDIVTNISSEGKKVLIVFDNLDRCEPKYAYETLSAIKTFMDKENCLYIIPCDDIAIKKYISSNYNITTKNDDDFSQIVGEEFFDKLFNTYIRIPQLQEIDRDIFIEEQLTKNPDLFLSDIDNKEYSLFIKRIKNLLPNKLPSIMPFIYLKETIDAKSISNELKDGSYIVNVNDSVVNRIKNEIQQMLEKNENSYLQNAALVIFNTLENSELTDKNRNQLIRILGDILSLENIHFVDFIEGISQVLNRFISYIPIMRDKQSIKIKELCSKYLRMNNEDDRLGDVQYLSKDSKILLFDKLTDNFNIFNESYVSLIFTDFKNITQIDESMQKYIEILNNKGKLSLVPTTFINFVIDTISKDSFSDNAINCLKYYDRLSLDSECKEQLANKLNGIITAIYSTVSNYSNQISLLDGINLSLKLIDKNSFDEKMLSSFSTVLCQFINNLFQYNPQTAMNLLVESMAFVTDETDSTYENVLRTRLMPSDNQKTFIKILIDNNYELHVKNIINCSTSKRFLLGITEIRKASYILLKDSIDELYTQLLREDRSMEDLKTLLEVISENNIKINNGDFKDYIISKYYDGENLEKTFSLYELLNNNNINVVEKDFTPIKNKTIDLYKRDAKSGMRYLQIACNILTEKQFNKIFLTPILNYICNELEATKPVSAYMNIVTLINSETTKSNSKLLKEIVAMLLEDNQETAEYEFAFNILSILNENSIDVKEFQEVVQLRVKSVNSDLQSKIAQIYVN